MGRVRRKWAFEEESLLKMAVSKAQEAGRPLNWHNIAASIPGRTNKDCRKRWFGKTAATVNKGAWLASEDERLCIAVKQHGPKWSVVASEVGTRTGDQCSKRWNHTVDPDIDHSEWTPKEDEQLLDSVKQYGRNWQQIVSIYFPRRTSLGAKNRYHLLCRKSEGTRSYSKFKVAPVSNSILPVAVNRDNKEFETDQSDDSDSENETEGEAFRSFDEDSYASGQNRSTSGSGDAPYVNDDAYNPLITSLLPYPDRDLSNHAYGMTDAPNLQQGRGQMCTTTSTSSEKASMGSSTRYSIGDVYSEFPVDPTKASFFGDSTILDDGMIFDHEPDMLNIGPSSVINASNAYSQTQLPPNIASASLTSSTALTTPNSNCSHGNVCSSAALMESGQEMRSRSTRRISIQAVCNLEDFGKIVQAVTELTVSAIFKTDE